MTFPGGFVADEIVRTTLPAVLRQAPNAWVPVHKYVRRANLPDGSIPTAVQTAMKRVPKGNYSVPPGAQEMSLSDLVEAHGLAKALNLVCSFPHSDVNASELRQLLVDHIAVLSGGDANLGTAFGKATALFDLLQFGPNASPAPALATPAKRSAGVRAAPEAAAVRRWAISKGMNVSAKGRLSADLLRAYMDAHPMS